MKKPMLRLFAPLKFSLAVAVSTVLLGGAQTSAQCPAPVLSSGLQTPLSITQSDKGNLLVSETGTVTPNTGRISIVDVNGHRRTLLDGLPSGINDVNEVSGPAGLFLRENTLYIAIGVGDVGRAGPVPGTTIPNPNPLSSPLFSSILALNFSDRVERTTSGFTLTLAHQQALANGEKVTLSNGGGDRITIELVANFPDYIPEPLPSFAGNIRLSNPFDLVLVRDQKRRDDEDHHGNDDDHDRCQTEFLYVTDGGRNLVWKVDINSGAFSMLAVFPPIANPLFPAIGGPFVDAVPTGITHSNDRLLVTLFRGFPFPQGASVVEQVDPLTGSHTPLIVGLKTAIDVLPLERHRDTDYLVLQHDSFGPPPFPPFSSPGLLLRFETPVDPATVIANCLTRPTSMTFDKKTGTLYVTELGGRIVTIPVTP